MKTRGFHQAATVPVGASITRVYFCEPGVGSPARRGEFETHRDALAVAIEAKTEALAAQPKDGLLPETITIDVRWVMSYPTGSGPTSGTDTLAERYTYDTVADAQAHLGRIDKYATPALATTPPGQSDQPVESVEVEPTCREREAAAYDQAEADGLHNRRVMAGLIDEPLRINPFR